MRKIIYINLFLLLASCNSQGTKDKNRVSNKPQSVKHNKNDNEYDYKKLISSKTEYFDIKTFYQNNRDGLGKTYETDNGNLVEESAGQSGGWFTVYLTPKTSMFTIYKEYDYKGVIRTKCVNFRNDGGAVGIKYEFDESGKLIKEIDTDINYKITPEDVIKYCKENSIDLFSPYTTIERLEDKKSNQSFYNINYRGKYGEKFGSRIIIQLDGNSGEIRKVICINGKHNDSVEVLYDEKAEKEKKEQEDKSYYKTYEGKDYTKEEWEAFEEAWYKNYQKKKNIKGF